MPSFETMFRESKGKPVAYKGQSLVMVDDFPIQNASTLRLVFEACNGEWRQGVSLRIRGKGELVINKQRLKHAICWHHTAPKSIDLEFNGKVDTLEVKNVWDVGDGVVHSWHNGAAMIVEPTSSGRRYRCNDGFADEDFDDIVFRLDRVEAAGS